MVVNVVKKSSRKKKSKTSEIRQLALGPHGVGQSMVMLTVAIKVITCIKSQ